MALASIFAAALSLFGCGVTAKPEDITSVSVGCYSGMNRYSYFSFELAEVEGEILFSCHYYGKSPGHEEVTLEDVPVDARYMAGLREIVAEQGFLKMRAKEPRVFIRDAEKYALELRWPTTKGGRAVTDSLRMTGYSRVTGADALEAYLRGIAAALIGEPDQADVALQENRAAEIVYLSLACNHAMAGYGYNYSLEEDYDDGRILFSCDNFYDYGKKEVRLDSIAVDKSAMERLREIAAVHEFAKVLNSEPGEADTRPDAPQYSIRIYRRHYSELYGYYHPPGAEELLAFFEEIAKAYEDIPAIPQ